MSLDNSLSGSSGLFLVFPPIRGGVRPTRPSLVPLVSVSLDVRIERCFCKCFIRQIYWNRESAPPIGHSTTPTSSTGADSVEAVYAFPLYSGGVVSRFSVKVGDDKLLEGDVVGRADARTIYERSLSAGLGAYMVEQVTPDVFKCRLGNIPKDEKIEIFIEYVHEVDFLDCLCRYTLPVHIAPRYSPTRTGRGGGGDVWSKTEGVKSRFSLADSEGEGPKLDVKVVMDMGCKVVSVESPTHPIKAEYVSQNVWSAELSQVNNYLNKDFVLLVECSHPETPHAVWTDFTAALADITETDEKQIADASDEVGNGSAVQNPLREEDRKEADKRRDGVRRFRKRFTGAAVVSFVPQFINSTSEETGIDEFVFLMDRSGSMAGPRMKQSKRAVMLFVKSLPPGCKFNIVGFGSTFLKWRQNSVIYDEQSCASAVTHVQNIDADLGGTEIMAPLKYILEEPTPPNTRRHVLVLSDGQVTNEWDVIRYVRQRHRVGAGRVFALGIGSGVSSYLIKGMAIAGRGRAHFVSDKEDIRESVMGLLKKAMQPAIENLTVSWIYDGGKNQHTSDADWDVVGKDSPTGPQPAPPAKAPSSLFFDPAAVLSRKEALAKLPANNAEWGGESCEDVDDCDVAVVRRLVAEVLGDDTAATGGAPFLQCPVTAALFSGGLFSSYILFSTEQIPSRVVIRGTTTFGQELSLEVPLQQNQAEKTDMSFYRLAARNLLSCFEDARKSSSSSYRDQTSNGANSVALSIGLAAKLVSQWTSFVVVEYRKEEDRLKSRRRVGLIPQIVIRSLRGGALPTDSKACAVALPKMLGRAEVMMADVCDGDRSDDDEDEMCAFEEVVKSDEDFIQNVAMLQSFDGRFEQTPQVTITTTCVYYVHGVCMWVCE
eukprot:GHVS01064244.1.p1 GENE.GHVS01064244.1~~GHVS01064244.1.p1  ORF type:complete len:883 (-),score=140.10 GHVS01064244.1:18-2666(-)